MMAGQGDEATLLWEMLLVMVSFSFSAQIVNYALSRAKVVDNFTGAVEFLPGLLYSYARSRHEPQQTLVTLLAVLWSLRLTIFLLLRLTRRSMRDTRLVDESRELFWALHGSWAPACTLPILVNNAYPTGSIGMLSALGLVVWAIGFTLESMADAAKLAAYERGRGTHYYNANEHPLWQCMRHPNFAGEILCWVGINIAAAGPVVARPWPLAFAPLAALAFCITIMYGEAALLTEWKNNRRYGRISGYKAWRSATPMLLPGIDMLLPESWMRAYDRYLE